MSPMAAGSPSKRSAATIAGHFDVRGFAGPRATARQRHRMRTRKATGYVREILRREGIVY